jgi:glycine C-acetyltransferase
MVDECHATGFVGKTGRGTPEYFGVEVDAVNSTLGKALGGATGGYTTGKQEIIDILRQKSRPYLFSNSVAPAIVGASMEAFLMLSSSTVLRDKLHSNTIRFRKGMSEAGFRLLGHAESPIVPIMIGDARLATEFANEMLTYGIYVIGFSFPVVPNGAARIRVQLSAGHDFNQVDKAIEAFTAVAQKKGTLPNPKTKL